MNQACLRCSFCGWHQADVGQLVKGRTSAFICDVCVDAAAGLIAAARLAPPPPFAVPPPANDADVLQIEAREP